MSLSTGKRPPGSFHAVQLAALAAGTVIDTYVTITGTVDKIHLEKDGDLHLHLTDGEHFVICEIVPEESHKPPKEGDVITVWGTARHDGVHGWWEIHPVAGWK